MEHKIVNQKYNGVETLMGNATCAGLAVMLVILSTGHISDAHLNPSLTIAFAFFRHFPWVQVPAYIIAQVSGSICTSFALRGIYHPFLIGGVTVPSVSTAHAFLLEFVITFNLLFVVTAVATDTKAISPNMMPLHFLTTATAVPTFPMVVSPWRRSCNIWERRPLTPSHCARLLLGGGHGKASESSVDRGDGQHGEERRARGVTVTEATAVPVCSDGRHREERCGASQEDGGEGEGGDSEHRQEHGREKAVETKDTTAGAAHGAAEYTSQKAAEANASTGAAVQAVASKAGASKDEAGEAMEAGDGAGQSAEIKDKIEKTPQETEIDTAEDDANKTAEQRLRELSVGDEQPGLVEAAEHGDSGESYNEGEAAAPLQGEPKLEEKGRSSTSSDVGGFFEVVGGSCDRHHADGQGVADGAPTKVKDAGGGLAAHQLLGVRLGQVEGAVGELRVKAGEDDGGAGEPEVGELTAHVGL